MVIELGMHGIIKKTSGFIWQPKRFTLTAVHKNEKSPFAKSEVVIILEACSEDSIFKDLFETPDESVTKILVWTNLLFRNLFSSNIS